jgi:nucleoside-triphosphatase THEP1
LDITIFDLHNTITILTGKRGSGKTRTCQNWVDQARQAGWKVSGVLSPGVFVNNEKIGIDVVNLATGECCRLADHVNRQTGFDVTDHWDFSADVLIWSNDVLGENQACDLFIVDELGPLEFIKRQGWVKAFDSLKADFFQKAVVVIRHELLEEARALWMDAEIIDLDS